MVSLPRFLAGLALAASPIWAKNVNQSLRVVRDGSANLEA